MPLKCQEQLFADVLQIGVLKNFEIFTGKHLRWNRPAISLKRDFSVPCEYCEILQNSFFIEHLP